MPLKIDRLKVSHGPIVAVRDFTAMIAPGQAVAIIGPNGAGKTSLLAGIGGQVAHEGFVELDGRALHGLPAYKRSQAGLGFVPSSRGVFPSVTVRDHVRLAAGADDRERWDEIVSLFPVIGEKRDALGANLSGGQQQLVSISRAMATKPAYILLDEPSIGLSPVAIGQLAKAIRTLAERNVGVLITEQNAGLALAISDYCLVMVRGEIRLTGTPDELKGRPEVQALYMGQSARLT